MPKKREKYFIIINTCTTKEFLIILILKQNWIADQRYRKKEMSSTRWKYSLYNITRLEF